MRKGIIFSQNCIVKLWKSVPWFVVQAKYQGNKDNITFWFLFLFFSTVVSRSHQKLLGQKEHPGVQGLVLWKQLQRGASPGPWVCRGGSCSSRRAVSRREQPAQGSGGGNNFPGSRGERPKSVATQRVVSSDNKSPKERSAQWEERAWKNSW